jgi:hypothetical protein
VFEHDGKQHQWHLEGSSSASRAFVAAILARGPVYTCPHCRIRTMAVILDKIGAEENLLEMPEQCLEERARRRGQSGSRPQREHLRINPAGRSSN